MKTGYDPNYFMDKLDRINEKNTIHSNLVKWWNVNLVDMVLIGDEENPENTYEELLEGETTNEAESEFTEEVSEEISPETLDTANEIYARLMAEAAADEAAKQAEIEAAKLASENM